METDDLSIEQIAGAGLGVYVALAGVATLVGMPWQYLGGGIALLVLRALGGVAAAVGGAALIWFAMNRNGAVRDQ